MRGKLIAGTVSGGMALAGSLGIYFASAAGGNAPANGPAKVDGNQLPIAQVIEELLLISECSVRSEWEGVVAYLPL